MQSKTIISDEELLQLILKWKENPSEYTRILTSQIYPTLYSLTKLKVENFTERSNVETTTSSVVNDVFIKLKNGAKNQHHLGTLRGFYDLLGQIIISLLLDKERKKNSQKRNGGPIELNNSSRFSDEDISILSDSLDKLKQIEPEVAEVLSLKFYSAKSNEQISYIMQQSLSATEKNIRNGKLMMNAIIQGVELRTH